MYKMLNSLPGWGHMISRLDTHEFFTRTLIGMNTLPQDDCQLRTIELLLTSPPSFCDVQTLRKCHRFWFIGAYAYDS